MTDKKGESVNISKAARQDIEAMEKANREKEKDLKRSDDWRLADVQRIVLELKRELAQEVIRRHDLEQRVHHLEEAFTRHRSRHATGPDLSYMG
jgi:hypothetical protein